MLEAPKGVKMQRCSVCSRPSLWQRLSDPSASPCPWCWTPCGLCGASELASMTTSTPVPWRRGSTRWKTSSPSTSLWSQACRQASSSSWPIYYGENTDTSIHLVLFCWRMFTTETIWIMWLLTLEDRASGRPKWGPEHWWATKLGNNAP